jgi:hypothetical protein
MVLMNENERVLGWVGLLVTLGSATPILLTFQNLQTVQTKEGGSA